MSLSCDFFGSGGKGPEAAVEGVEVVADKDHGLGQWCDYWKTRIWTEKKM